MVVYPFSSDYCTTLTEIKDGFLQTLTYDPYFFPLQHFLGRLFDQNSMRRELKSLLP
jgi:hypothetical protein